MCGFKGAIIADLAHLSCNPSALLIMSGLAKARDILEPIKSKFPWISYADLWTLAGVVAIESMGGEGQV